ncbi:hypothetical protein LguiB_031162 [Lonicera macranthoides]
MKSELGRRPIMGGKEGSFGDEMEKELGLLLREQRRQDTDDDREKELNMYRSGSAPPTIAGSLSAVGNLFDHGGGGFREFPQNKAGNAFLSEEELRSDPAYLSYYYSNVNLNPRLPPPIREEDWRSSPNLQGASSTVGGIGDRRKANRYDSDGGGLSLFSMPPGFNSNKQESESDLEKVKLPGDWGGDGLIGLPRLGLGSKQKSLAEIFQEDLGHPSRPISHNTHDDNSQTLGSSDAELVHLHRDLGMNIQSSSAVQHVGPPASSYSYAAALGATLSRSTTPDPQRIARAPSPCSTPIGGGRFENLEKKTVSSNSFTGESVDLVASFSGINLSKDGVMNEENRLPSHIEPDVDNLFDHHLGPLSSKVSYSNSVINSPLQVDMHKTGAGSNNPHLKVTSTYALSGGGGLISHYQHADGANSSFPNYGLSGSYMNSPVPIMSAGHLGNFNLPPLFGNAAAASMAVPGMDPRMLGGGLHSSLGSQNLSRIGNQMTGSVLQAPFVDPMYPQFSRTGFTGPVERDMVNSYMDLLQKAYVGSMLSHHKSQYGVPLGSPIGMQYPGSLANHLTPNSPVGPGSPIGMRYPSGMRNLGGDVVGPWRLDTGYNVDNSFAYSLLEDFKGNKTRCFELSEIAGHVVEFSADQYGSRFIQQKLETATTEEKNMVFEEIIPQALTLMTDVFGNYVVQKFLEHGMPSQRRELANHLFGHVLTLSLQMYGCRVIQKAIEVVDLDQKIKMVQELDGHIMRCVRDQNGNHVIQKCIECVPEEHIQFIVSTFSHQVVILSTHPYGCRVIQRVLEHCMEPQTQSKMMEEILGSISMLAQDQYGNYVVQHVLEHGQPHERSFIIQELGGKIVPMSQQKFASNVVEKCLAFGNPTERQLLVNEMLGLTDENEPLQAMMKDQFANYVVQKVLETCSDQQRELILSRIKVHLDALKKYTYGKHIVARVEKLVAAGERRIAAQSPNAA